MLESFFLEAEYKEYRCKPFGVGEMQGHVHVLKSHLFTGSAGMVGLPPSKGPSSTVPSPHAWKQSVHESVSEQLGLCLNLENPMMPIDREALQYALTMPRLSRASALFEGKILFRT